MADPGEHVDDSDTLEEAMLAAVSDAATGGSTGSMDLTGAGRHYLWAILPTIASLLAAIFVLSYSVRKLGPRDYGAVVTIISAVTILTLFSGAIRYAVVRAGAKFDVGASARSRTEITEQRSSIRAAHALFVAAAGAILALALALGWLIPLDLHLHGDLAVQTYIATVIFVGSSSFGFAFTAYAGVLTGTEEFGRLAQISLGGLAIQVAGTVLLVGPMRIVGIAIASLIATVVQQLAIYAIGRRRVPWLKLVPRRPKRSVAATVLRYAAGLAVLSATSTICAASDAFIIGDLRGGAAVTVFRIGSTAPTTLTPILFSSFGVLFPRLARTESASDQEHAIGWLGNIVGWLSGALFAGLCLLAADLVRLLLGHANAQADEVLWISAAALTIDVSYHGVVQVIFARGQQGLLAKYSWVELVFNLAATYVFVRLEGPVGSAWALAGTIVVTDIIGFPWIMRGRWGSPAGRFVLTHGVVASAVAAGLTLLVGIPAVLATHGFGLHVAIVGGDLALVYGAGILLLSRSSRERLRRLVRPSAPKVS